jgi:protocatechuate 3,4-dioxygenase beta subunit
MSTTTQLASQADISARIAAAHAAAAPGETQPRIDFAAYGSALLRHPTKAMLEADLTIQAGGEPIGERIVVAGRVLDGDGRPVRNQLVEVWQANAAGRYVHKRDQHPAPLDPHFTGVGRCLTDDDGSYRFTTIKPGPYPWRNHRNAWRPAHIHFSLFGTDFTQRMVTQMYFPGDPLFALDPIYQAITDQAARDRLVATYDHDLTTHEWATGYRWDIVLTGSHGTPMEREGDDDE